MGSMDNKIIYLDNAATTKVYDEVKKIMTQYLSDNFYNPNGVYLQAQDVRKDVENARAFIAKTINAEQNEIFFTSCGSEANSWAIKGIAEKYKNKGNNIITSKIEHHSVLNSMKHLEDNGFNVTYLNVDENGFIDIENLQNAISNNTILVSIMHANNEIGTIEPIEKIGEICHSKGVVFHVDAVQTLGHERIDVKKNNIDLLSASAHKFGGPKGVGFMYKKKNILIDNIIEGGEQEFYKRGGTENVAGIIGMAKALEISTKSIDEDCIYESNLRDYCIERILKEIPYTKLNGDVKKRLANNVNISFSFVEGESIVLSLNKYGVCSSSGSSCASSSLEPSHVLLAIGLSHELAHGSLRLTLSTDVIKEDIDFVVDNLKEIIEKLRSMSPLYEDFIKNKM